MADTDLMLKNDVRLNLLVLNVTRT